MNFFYPRDIIMAMLSIWLRLSSTIARDHEDGRSQRQLFERLVWRNLRRGEMEGRQSADFPRYPRLHQCGRHRGQLSRHCGRLHQYEVTHGDESFHRWGNYERNFEFLQAGFHCSFKQMLDTEFWTSEMSKCDQNRVTSSSLQNPLTCNY